jgi:hypothetical protein
VRSMLWACGLGWVHWEKSWLAATLMLTMAMPVDVVDLAGGIVVCLLPVPASTMGFLG